MVPVHSEQRTSRAGISAKLTQRALLGVISCSSFAFAYLIGFSMISLLRVPGRRICVLLWSRRQKSDSPQSRPLPTNEVLSGRKLSGSIFFTFNVSLRPRR